VGIILISSGNLETNKKQTRNKQETNKKQTSWKVYYVVYKWRRRCGGCATRCGRDELLYGCSGSNYREVVQH
jgi:hypothetical protein